jgi:hypothetical protein
LNAGFQDADYEYLVDPQNDGIEDTEYTRRGPDRHPVLRLVRRVQQHASRAPVRRAGSGVVEAGGGAGRSGR